MESEYSWLAAVTKCYLQSTNSLYTIMRINYTSEEYNTKTSTNKIKVEFRGSEHIKYMIATYNKEIQVKTVLVI